MKGRLAGLLITCVLLLGARSPAVARPDAQPSGAPPETSPAAREPVRLPPELEGSARQHIGKAEESVCYVTVEMRDPQTGRAEKRHGSGFVIRCDGFLLVPTALLSSRQADGEGRLSEVRFPERANEFRFLTPKRGKTPPAQQVGVLHFFKDSRGFVAAKVNGWHMPALPLLTPSNIRPGMPVRIVYARPRPSDPKELETVSAEAVVGEKVERSRRWTLDPAKGLPAALPGAVVIDKASGLALGIVPGKALRGEPLPTVTEFLDLNNLYQVTNAVALLPSPSVVTPEANQPAAGAEQNGMVWIPGGPIVQRGLYQELRSHSPENRLYGNVAFCMRGFWIDKRPVTNEEYRRFLKATGYAPLPRFWDASERENLRRPGEMPVMGIGTVDAMAYGQWAGKRLVTPAEWDRASFGGLSGDWHDAYDRAKRLAWDELLRRTWRLDLIDKPGRPVLDILAEENILPPEVHVRGLNPPEDVGGPPMRLVVGSIVIPIEKHFGYPGVIAPVNARERDISLFGVADVSLNALELLIPNVSVRENEIAGKMHSLGIRPDIFPAWHDIDLGLFVWLVARWGGLVGSDGYRIHQSIAEQPRNRWPLTISPPGEWRMNWELQNYSWPTRLQVLNSVGFRCAR